MESKGDHYNVKLEHPVISSGLDSPARERLNTQMAASALRHLEQIEDDPIPFDEYAKNFANDFASMKKETPAMGDWANESIMEIVHQGRTLITTRCQTYTNTGGAHPNRFTHYENYAVRDGRLVEFAEMVEEGKMPAVRALVEKHFRAIRGITSDADLKEKGFHFEPGQLEVDKSVGFLKEHALFHFDPYDVAAHALGETEVPVRYDELRGLLKPQFLP